MNARTSPRRNRPARPSAARTFGWFAAASLVFAAVAPSAAAANTTMICHATASGSNPYVETTPAIAGQLTGHADHTGPIWTPGATSWGDIIPPISDLLPAGLNWTAEGQAWLANGCQAPVTEDNGGGGQPGDTGGSGGDTSGSGDNSGSGDQQSGDNTGDTSGSGDQGNTGGDNAGDQGSQGDQGANDNSGSGDQGNTGGDTAGDNTGGQGDTRGDTSNAGDSTGDQGNTVDNSNAGDNTGGSTVSPVAVPVQPVDQPAATPAPEGGVAGVVSAPRPTPRLTLPPTSTLSSAPVASTPIPAWRLILIGLAALISSLLLMSSDRTARRRS